MQTKIAVVYQSKTGFTQKYAQWIAEAVNGDLIKGNEVKMQELLKYDTIVYGGGLYAGGIHGIKLITCNFEQLKHKNLIVFWVGVTPVRQNTMDEIKNKSFTQEQQKFIRFFMLRGGFNYQLCTPVDKVLMKLLKLKLSRVKNPDADQRGMLASYNHPLDFADIKYITPIVEQIANSASS